MEEAFGVVIFVVVIVAAVIGVATLGSRSRAYDQIGRGGMSLRDGTDQPVDPPVSGAVAAGVRDEEIRQMVAARNARRVRRGEEPVDVETELTRLTAAPSVDPGLEAEVRSLVVARNERRARRGEEPLDVEAEVARQISELSG